jgi:hypothetical protein
MEARTMRPIRLLVVLGMVISAAPAAGRELAVTVYNQDLGVVRDKRTVEVEAGRAALRVTDVAERIDPTSVHLEGLDVVEQNYAFDLASAEKILHRYLGEVVDVLAAEGRSYRGKLLAYDGGALVLGGAGGGDEVTIVGREGVQDIRCPSLPAGLITRPTLIWLVEGAKGGKAEVELSYMTGGMSWHAEYVAVVSADDKSLDLSGWVSVDNRSGATYPEAKLKLVAGEVHRAAPPIVELERAERRFAKGGAAPQFVERGLFEYHIYELERATTIADQEVKQVALFAPARTPVKKIYEYDGMYGGMYGGTEVKVTLETENKEEVGLGMPLPAGTVRAFKADADRRLEFVGEDRIEHTPRGEKVRIVMGSAFDVKAERVVADHRQISDRVYEETIEIKVRNHKREAVEVVVIEHPPGSWEILTSSHAYEKKEAFKIEFKVPAAPDREEIVRYTVRVR